MLQHLGIRAAAPAKDVLMNPAAYTPRIILPYKNGMWGMKESKIGTGVSVIDKASLYQSILTLLENMVGERPEATRISPRGHKFSCFSNPQEYANSEEFRQWVSKCVETDEIIFEIYGLWNDPAQQELLQQVQAKSNKILAPIVKHPACEFIVCAKKLGILPMPCQMIKKKRKYNVATRLLTLLVKAMQ